MNTTGTVRVVCSSGATTEAPPASMTSGERAMISAARVLANALGIGKRGTFIDLDVAIAGPAQCLQRLPNSRRPRFQIQIIGGGR